MTNSREQSNLYFIRSIRLLFIIALMSIIAGRSKITVYAKEYASGKCGNNLTYTVTGNSDDNLTLTIRGTGDMWDYYEGSSAGDRAPWNYIRIVIHDGLSYYNVNTNMIKTVILEEGVTSIGMNAFYGYNKNKGYQAVITFPKTLKRINDQAFAYSGIYGNLIIPEGVTYIGASAFEGCDSLNGYLSLPNSLTYIGDGAFYGVYNVTGNLKLPENLTSISSFSFYNCYGLTSVTFGSKLFSIEEYAFSNCTGITSLQLPNTLTQIGQYAFNGSGLSGSIDIPASVNHIKSNAFTNTPYLYAVQFLGNAPTENSDAFDNTRVTIIYKKSANGFTWPTWHGYNSDFDRVKVTGVSITPANQIINVGDTATLTAVIEPSNADIKDLVWRSKGDELNIDGNVFTYQFTSAGNYILDVTTMDGGFIATGTIMVIERESIPVTGITVYPSKKSIFYGENAVFTATLTPSNADVQEINWTVNGERISGTSNQLTFTKPSIGTYNIIATSIDGGYRATCTLTVKQKESDSNESSPTDKKVNKSAKVGDRITYKKAVYQITKLPSGNKTGEAKLVSVTKTATKISVPKSFKYLGKSYSVTKIAAGACKNNKKITSFTIGANVTSIGDSAFLNCSKLKSTKIPDKVTTIGKNAYKNCSAMTTAYLGKNVSKINDYAFYNCKKLKNWSIKSSKLKKLGKNALKNTPKTASYDVPNGVIKSYKKQFIKAGAGKTIKVK